MKFHSGGRCDSCIARIERKLFDRLKLPLLTIVLLMNVAYGVQAQVAAPHRLVNAPTAGTLNSRTYILETHLFDGGGVTQRLNIGVTDLLDIGISYSGSNIIGSHKVVWQPHVGAQVRVRIVEETMNFPAFAVGFDSQGDGRYVSGDKLNRFSGKSKGIYVVVSRNYNFLGDLGFHGGANYSFETDDGDNDPSFWIGIDKSILSAVTLCCEYDFATNDNENNFTNDRGYLNTAVKLNLGGAFTLEFDVQNILRNAQRDFSGTGTEKKEPARELKLFYTNRF